jgi:hypothetical protein
MFPGPVALVHSEIIDREAVVTGFHEKVPDDLGQDRGGPDGVAETIPLDQALLGKRQIQGMVAVHQDQVRSMI